MTPVDARRIQQLLARILAGGDYDAEIIAAVRALHTVCDRNQIDRKTAKLAIEGVGAGTISMVDDRQDVAVRLRGLAIMFQRARHTDAGAAEAMVRFIDGVLRQSHVSAADLRRVLASTRDLIKQLEAQVLSQSTMNQLDEILFQQFWAHTRGPSGG